MMIADPQLQLTAALVLSAVLASAAWHKLRSAADFERVLARYDLLPQASLALLSRLLPALELVLALALLLPFSRAGAGAMSALLLLTYMLAIAVNLLRGRSHIDCGCGDTDTGLSPGLLWRNAYLLAFAVTVAAPAFIAPASPLREGSWLDLVFAVLGACALGLIYATWTQLLANQSYRQRMGP